MRWRLPVLAMLGGSLAADDRLLRALERLAEEASAFQRIAPDLQAEETLRQRALRPAKRRFRPHLGQVPRRPAEWQSREIVSLYGYSVLGETAGIREFRKPVALDGRALSDSDSALESLASGIRSIDDRRKLRLLEEFEKLGLIGTVTDFGQSLLLFARRNQENFEFDVAGVRLVGADNAVVIRYRQHQGAASLTLWNNGRLARQGVNGEILIRERDSLPLRVTLTSVLGQGPEAVRQEASVDYLPTEFGTLVPAAVLHRELRAGQLTAENAFSYSRFVRLRPVPASQR